MGAASGRGALVPRASPLLGYGASSWEAPLGVLDRLDIVMIKFTDVCSKRTVERFGSRLFVSVISELWLMKLIARHLAEENQRLVGSRETDAARDIRAS